MFFENQFKKITGFLPMNWQVRLFKDYFSQGIIPSAIDLPTGLGKTAVMTIWKLALDVGARLPRRLIYVVDRRAVVDQATTEAEKIKTRSGDLSLRVSTLRGQHIDNREWLENPTSSAIIVGTVDMIGSRLLFSGYGVSRKMRAYHAGLLGVDSLIVLDESHLVPPFEKLMEAIETGDAVYGLRCEEEQQLVPKCKLLSLSATGRTRLGEIFTLDASKGDLDDEVVTIRLNARKTLTLIGTTKKAIEETLAEEAWKRTCLGVKPLRIIIYCNQRKKAEIVHRKLTKKAVVKGIPAENIQLLVGSRRVKERILAANQLEQLGFLNRNDMRVDHPSFLVATSAGEVGIDLDADHMISDLVPWERMVQRFGRVNRRGLGSAKIVVVHEGEPKPDEQLALIAWRCCEIFTELDREKDGCVDVSPGALQFLKSRAAADPTLKQCIDAASTPPPLYPALTRALVDAWSMTSLEKHTGRPTVHPWLRGWTNAEPQTAVVWRRYLPVRYDGCPVSKEEVEGFFDAAPPHYIEILETETWGVIDWAAQCAAAALNANKIPKDCIVAIILTRSGQFGGYFSLENFQSINKKAHSKLLKDAILIVDARIGGLSHGLLDAIEEEVVDVGDIGNWPGIPYQVRIFTGEENLPGVKISFSLPRRYSPEGDDLERIEVITSITETEKSRAMASQDQLLEDHSSKVESMARCIARNLHFSALHEEVLGLAAKLHDTGKEARTWQLASNAPNDGIYAKTRGPFNTFRLEGYRHEFGSLRNALNDPAIKEMPSELRDLALHLIVAHHGQGRPLISTSGCGDIPPSKLLSLASEVAARFAHLQRQWGPWGLAWWESLLRAADQQASRSIDEKDESDDRS